MKHRRHSPEHVLTDAEYQDVLDVWLASLPPTEDLSELSGMVFPQRPASADVARERGRFTDAAS